MNGNQPSALQAARRASERTATVVHGEMKRGLDTLAAVVSTAPWIGIIGTLVGIVNSFVGCGAPKSVCMAAVVERLSASIWFTALGLGVALVALWVYKYLLLELERFDSEMENATLC